MAKQTPTQKDIEDTGKFVTMLCIMTGICLGAWTLGFTNNGWYTIAGFFGGALFGVAFWPIMIRSWYR